MYVGNTLKVKSTGCLTACQVREEEKSQSRMESFGLSNWKGSVAIIEIRKTVGDATFLMGDGGKGEIRVLALEI